MRRTILLALAALPLALPAAPAPLPAQEGPGVGEYRGAAALGLALRRLGTTKRVLMVGAHPDDEDTQLLAALALEQGADVAYLSLTRGEGGQNGIGPELGEGLGLLRTEELLAARRVDGARQFFTRAYDFGFSKSAEETWRHWPRDVLLGDVVAVIRRFRPDIVIPVFSGTPRDGHGHHQVSAILAREAYLAAGDSTKFPEQIAAGLRPHRPAKLYRSLRGSGEGATARLQIGNLDPLIGRSPFQLAMASRSRHRSQDMGRPEPAGPRWGYLLRLLPAPAGEEASIWAGIDTLMGGRTLSPSRSAHPLERAMTVYDLTIAEIKDSASVLNPGALVPRLAGALAALRPTLRPGDRGGRLIDPEETRFRIDNERRDAEEALALAAGLVLDAVASDARIVPGQDFTLDLTLWNGGREAVQVDSLVPVLPAGWTAARADSASATTVEPGGLLARRFRVRVPASARTTEPYFLSGGRRGGALYRWPDDRSVHGLPFEPAPVRAAARVRVAGAALPLETEATFREVDLRQGELRRPVLVVPAVSVIVEPRVVLHPEGAGRPLRLRVRLASEDPGGIEGTLRFQAPAGWRVEPAEVPLKLGDGERREVEVDVHVPAGAGQRNPEWAVTARFESNDARRFTRGVEIVDYPHVRARPLPRDAETRVRIAPVAVPRGLRVAYIEGAGEEGPGVLAQIGIVPDLLDAEDLATGDLSTYDVIVAGSRAYEVRHDLMANNARLLEYVRRGGTFIVQYNKYELVEGRFTPFPLTMARPHGRVTDEEAPVRILDPSHPVFTTPNRITENDFAGWVQERGLYFADTWDPAYTPLLETGDPGEAPLRGGLLVAKHGQGTYVYTGLAFFRQLPEGVPGAWRLFANLLALGAKR
ncbi:MAG TPA: PIG-L family deacetylase [Longimicrobium sp.]|nr:PIG-L family deacetylase [Longimicrobium sp.]